MFYFYSPTLENYIYEQKKANSKSISAERSKTL